MRMALCPCLAGSVFRQCRKIPRHFIENVMADVRLLCRVVGLIVRKTALFELQSWLDDALTCCEVHYVQYVSNRACNQLSGLVNAAPSCSDARTMSSNHSTP